MGETEGVVQVSLTSLDSSVVRFFYPVREAVRSDTLYPPLPLPAVSFYRKNGRGGR